MPSTRKQRKLSIKEKKLINRTAKPAQDAEWTDKTSIRDSDLAAWTAPPILWSYQNLIMIAITCFKELIKLVGKDDPRRKFGISILL
jgi:hypothetical protein